MNCNQKTPGEILFLRTPIFFRASPERLFSFSKTVRHASNRNPYPLPLQLTPPGTLAAHGNFCLVLLCSQPDTVHRHPLRKTQTSSPLVKASNMSQKPSAYHHPCYSGFQVQGAAAPPAARWLQYNHFPEICQSDSVHSWLRLQKKRRFATIECLRSAHSIVLQMLQMNCTLHAALPGRLYSTRAARSVPSLPANPAHSNHKSDEFPRPVVPYPAP